jgi:hypothetical protein
LPCGVGRADEPIPLSSRLSSRERSSRSPVAVLGTPLGDYIDWRSGRPGFELDWRAESGQSDRQIDPPRQANGRQDGADEDYSLAAESRASSFFVLQGASLSCRPCRSPATNSLPISAAGFSKMRPHDRSLRRRQRNPYCEMLNLRSTSGRASLANPRSS